MCQCNRCGACSLNCQRGNSPRLDRAPRTPMVLLPQHCGDLSKAISAFARKRDLASVSYRLLTQQRLHLTGGQSLLYHFPQSCSFGTGYSADGALGTRNEYLDNSSRGRQNLYFIIIRRVSQRKGRKGQFSVLKGSKAKNGGTVHQKRVTVQAAAPFLTGSCSYPSESEPLSACPPNTAHCPFFQ